MALMITDVPQLRDEWDQERNYPDEPGQVTVGSHKRVSWICVEGHRFDGVVNSRFNSGRGGDQMPRLQRQTS